VQITTQGNTGIRRPHVTASDADTVSGTSWTSDAIPMNYCTTGILSLLWSDFNDTDAVAHVQGSYDGVLFNNLDGNGCLMDSTDDTQLWEFDYINVLYIRVLITYNSVTSGAFALTFRGEFNSSKNY
jgi:hypothetical protein